MSKPPKPTTFYGAMTTDVKQAPWNKQHIKPSKYTTHYFGNKSSTFLVIIVNQMLSYGYGSK